MFSLAYGCYFTLVGISNQNISEEKENLSSDDIGSCFHRYSQNMCSQNHPDGKESTVENLQRKIRRLESELEKRPEKKDGRDDRDKVGWSIDRSIVHD